MSRFPRFALLGALLLAAGAAAAPIDETRPQYKPTGGTGYNNGVVILQSIDAVNSKPINSGNPLPVSTSGTGDVNLKQVNGVTTSTGAGATGTGTQRVGVAQDVTTIAGSAPGTAGAPSSNVVSMQGVAGGTVLPVQTPRAGSATYRASTDGYAAYATPTDLLCLNGSASKTVVITNIFLGFNSTAAALQVVDFVKRSTANTGGTPSTLSVHPIDSASAAGTATVTFYGSAPTLGNSVGIIQIGKVASASLTAAPTPINLNGFTVASTVTHNAPVKLRGAAEGLCVNYRGAALTAGFVLTMNAEWVEYTE